MSTASKNVRKILDTTFCSIVIRVSSSRAHFSLRVADFANVKVLSSGYGNWIAYNSSDEARMEKDPGLPRR